MKKLTESQIRALKQGKHRVYAIRLHPGRHDWVKEWEGTISVQVDWYVSRVSKKDTREMLSINSDDGEDAEYSVCREKPGFYVSDDMVEDNGDLVFDDYMTRLYADWGEGESL